jgi:hypothetical protein
MKPTVTKRFSLAPLFSLTFALFSTTAPAFADHDGDTTVPMIVTGEVTVLQVDDFVNHRSQMIYLLQDNTVGKTFYLRFDKTPPANLQTGAKVTVQGVGRGNELVVAANNNSVQTISVAAATVSGVQNTIVILLNFLDATLECSSAAVNGLMFQNSASVNTLYQETSYGNVSFAGAVAGPYTLNTYSTNACNYDSWASAGESAASAAGFNLSQYPRRVYVFPKRNPCGWAGLGTIGGNPSRAWIAYCDLADVYAHELGHNVTMHHSSTDLNNDGTSDCEYCDVSDFMGYGGVGFRQVNAPHKEQMGWLPASKVVLAAGNTTVSLAPLELYPGTTSLPQALKVAKPNSGEYYYFSYRRRLGFDSSLGTDYADKANVHRYRGSGAIQTFFLGGLTTGQSFADPANGLTVTQTASTPDFVTLQVNFGSVGCTPAVPTVTMSPATQGGQAGATLSYTVQVVNNDSTSCSPSTFTVTPTAPAGWSASAPSNVTLSPGQSSTLTAAFTSPASVSAGNYSVGVNVTDGSEPLHNKSNSATYVVNVVDSSPPTAPTLSGSSKAGKVQLSWSGATDNVGVTAYRVWRNNSQIVQTTATSYQDAAVNSGTTYAYFVTAVDAAGNQSPASNTLTITVSKGGKPR